MYTQRFPFQKANGKVTLSMSENVVSLLLTVARFWHFSHILVIN